MRINYILLNRKLFYGKRYLKKLQKIIADTVSNYINNYLSLNIIHKFHIYIYICRVDVKIRVRVKGVKRIPIGITRGHYAIEEIFTSANMIMIEFDK